MFTFDRETMTMIAVVLSILATVYMYKELNKTKEDMNRIKQTFVGFVNHISSHENPNQQAISEDSDDEEVPVSKTEIKGKNKQPSETNLGE